MLYFSTEILIRMLLTAAVFDLAFLFPIFFVLYMVLWNARDVLRHLSIEYRVERSMREWRAQQRAKESTSQQEVATQVN